MRKPDRGLRQGDATSPVLFDIYHAQTMTKLSKIRSPESQGHAGIPWQWTPGCSLPPVDNKKAYGNLVTESIRVIETLPYLLTILPSWYRTGN